MAGSMFSFSSKGDFSNTERWLLQMKDQRIFDALSKYGEIGRAALASATPADTGETANAWYYEILKDATSWSLIWGNSHVNEGRPIAVLLQIGHATRTGGYVQGRDYMN